MLLIRTSSRHATWLWISRNVQLFDQHFTIIFVCQTIYHNTIVRCFANHPRWCRTLKNQNQTFKWTDQISIQQQFSYLLPKIFLWNESGNEKARTTNSRWQLTRTDGRKCVRVWAVRASLFSCPFSFSFFPLSLFSLSTPSPLSSSSSNSGGTQCTGWM